MKIPDLGSLCAYWQAELELRDWKITIGYVKDLCDAQGRPVWGLCSPLVDNKTATIQIRDPRTPPPGTDTDYAILQVEETIVHELTHLHFAPFGNCMPAEIAAEEQAVWALSGALIREKGKGGKTKAIVRGMLIRARAAQFGSNGTNRRQRKNMNAADVKKALDALMGDDPEKCKEMLKNLVAAEAGEGGGDGGGGADDVSADAGGDDDAGPGEGANAARYEETDPNKGDKGNARRSRASTRSARDTDADRHVARLASIATRATRDTIALALHRCRTVDGLTFAPAVESQILKCRSVEEADVLIGVAKATIEASKSGGNGTQRNDTGNRNERRQAAPPTGSGAADDANLTPMQRRLKASLASRGRDDLARGVKARKAQ